MADLPRTDASSVTRILLHTFGCKANQYDTEVVRQALVAAGATIVRDWAQADTAVVNSCTVTHVSEAKMRAVIRRAARRNPAIRTIVIGCAATLDDGSLAGLANVSDVLPGTAPDKVLEVLGLPPITPRPVLRSFERGARAWLKIQDGCDEHCTFCATTLARGECRSRAPEEIVEEALALGSQHAEIVLTGVHVGSYAARNGRARTLSDLLELLVQCVPNTRFRLTSVEATQVDDRLMALMAEAPGRVAPHLHAPLQSGSDRVLKRMGRHWYTAAAYRARIERLAGRIGQLGLGADVIVGFPGETDEDFALTRELVAALPFTYLHVFPYSERKGTAARRIGPPIDPHVTASRSAELRALAREKGAAYRRHRSGGPADVVLLRRSRGRFEGLTEDYLSVLGTTDRELPARFTARLSVDVAGDCVAAPLESVR